MKAQKISTSIAAAANAFPCEFILADSRVSGKARGTGEMANPVFIAGGISRDNFTEAAEIFKPVALIESFLREVRSHSYSI